MPRARRFFAHCQRIAEHYDLYRNALLHTEVRQIRWDDQLERWIVETDRGDAIRARFVSMANGYLQKPKLPGIPPGITAFAGHTFHTSRWDYEYTGKDLELLADKRIGIIGTGATAVQCVPHLARAAGHLSVFQRTPSSVDVRANRPTDGQWAAGLTPGWQRRRIENFQQLTAGGEADEDLVADAWTSIVKTLLVMRDGELADFAKMEEVRARVDAIVADPDTAEALKPWYGYFCKRPCFHDDYLATFNRPQRLSGRHSRPRGGGVHHRTRGRGRRRRARTRLSDLRNGIRGGHRIRAAHRLRGRRS